MGHFSMEIDAPSGSNLSGNQHLAHNASFHSTVKIVPSNAGTEQLKPVLS